MKSKVDTDTWLAEYANLEDKLTSWGVPAFNPHTKGNTEEALDAMEDAKIHLEERFSEIISTLNKFIWSKRETILFPNKNTQPKP